MISELKKQLKLHFNYHMSGYFIATGKNHLSRLSVGDRVKGYLSNAGYLRIQIKINNKPRLISLHRAIFLYHHGYLPKFIDHKNGNRLDNRIENLRSCTFVQNVANSAKRVNSASKHKGVTKDRNKWRVTCKKKHIGNFKTEIEAAKAYDKAALKEYGEFARLNFPEVGR